MKALFFLFLLEYLVLVGAAPTMKQVKEVKQVKENDISLRGSTLYDFASDCTNAVGPKLFTYTFDPARFANLVTAGTDGKVILKSDAVLDYEDAAQYNLWAVCNDTSTKQVATEQGAFSLVLLNENEAPVCTGCTSKSITISENRLGSANYNLGDSGMSVKDPDKNDKLSWTILPCSGKDYFSIQPSGGSPATATISTKVPIDFEDQQVSGLPQKELIIQVADAGGESLTATVTITITDYNDHKPVFTNEHVTASYFGIGTAVGTTVATLTATDGDASQNTVTYSVSTLSPAYPYFSFAGSTMQVANPIDVQWGDKFTVIVYATDSGSPAQSGTATVTILTETTTTTTTTVAPPSGYYFWNKKDNVIAFICLMIIAGLITGALIFGCVHYCMYGSCLPDCCNPQAKQGGNESWNQKQNNRPHNDDKYDYGRTPTPRLGTTSITQIGYQ